MRIDLDTRLSLTFVIGWGVVIGAGIANLFGLHVDPVVVEAGGGAVLTTIGVGIVRGTAGKANGNEAGG